MKKKENNKVIAEITEIIQSNQNDVIAYINRGTAYKNNKEYNQAISDYTEAIRIKPDDALTYSLRGDAYFLKGDYDTAIVNCTKAISFDQHNANAYFCRAESYKQKGKNALAVADYEMAAKYASSNEKYQKIFKKIEEDKAKKLISEKSNKKESKLFQILIISFVIMVILFVFLALHYSNIGKEMVQLKPFDKTMLPEECGTLIIPMNASVTQINGKSKHLTPGLAEAASVLIPAGEYTLIWSLKTAVDEFNDMSLAVSINTGKKYMIKYSIEPKGLEVICRYRLDEINDEEIGVYLRETKGEQNVLKKIATGVVWFILTMIAGGS